VRECLNCNLNRIHIFIYIKFNSINRNKVYILYDHELNACLLYKLIGKLLVIIVSL